MDDVHRAAAALLHRVADGGGIPLEAVRGFAELVLRSELVAVSHQVLHGEPEFALRRAMELSGLILAAVAKDDCEKEKDAAK